MNREWAIPVALGLLAAAVLASVPSRKDDLAVDGNDTLLPVGQAPKSILLFPFTDGPVIVDEPAQILILSTVDQPLGVRARNDTVAPIVACQNLMVQPDPPCEGYGVDWRTPRVGFANTSDKPSGEVPGHPGLVTCDCAYVGPGWHERAGPGSPRLGMDGYNATRATIYVFDERGLLAATNDAKENWTRFAGAPTTMESAVWYIGANSTTPNGTEKPPSFAAPLVQKLRPLMEGLPVGGVASTQSNAYVSLYGTLFITARIDELAYAP
ncbi:MAG: hypothetical protein ACYC2H_06700 [Thermoplasmatota archaeon]